MKRPYGVVLGNWSFQLLYQISVELTKTIEITTDFSRITYWKGEGYGQWQIKQGHVAKINLF